MYIYIYTCIYIYLYVYVQVYVRALYSGSFHIFSRFPILDSVMVFIRTNIYSYTPTFCNVVFLSSVVIFTHTNFLPHGNVGTISLEFSKSVCLIYMCVYKDMNMYTIVPYKVFPSSFILLLLCPQLKRVKTVP